MKKLFTLLFLVPTLFASAQINDGLMGKFYFNNGDKINEIDPLHSLYDGLQGYSNPTLTTDRFGNQSHAYYFNGNAAMYYYNTSSGVDLFNLNDLDAMSFSVWVKPDTINSNISQTILCRWNSSAFSEQFLLEISGTNTLTAIRVVNPDGDKDTTTYAAGNWYHIVFTYNKTDNNRHKVYVNGALKYNKTFAGTYAPTSMSTPFIIGMRSSGGNWFKGVIDDISVYSKALSDAEVNCLYNEPNPTTSPVTLGVTLSANPTSVCPHEPTTLTATPSGSVANYVWSAGVSSTTATATATPLVNTTYTVTVTDASGCYGATASVAVDVKLLPQPSVIVSGANLSTQSFNSYQWQLNGNNINGATNQTYTATQSGSYTVVVTDANGCSNTSNAVNVTISSVSEIVDFRSIIYPNPATTDLMIEASEQLEEVQISDVTGRIVFTQSKILNLKSTIDVSTLAEATYFIHIKTTSGKTAVKTFVKQ